MLHVTRRLSGHSIYLTGLLSSQTSRTITPSFQHKAWRLSSERGTASKPPVYFSGAGGLQQSRSRLGNQGPLPTYFGNGNIPANANAIPVLSRSVKGRNWSLWIAYGLMGCSLISAILVYRRSAKNREEVPFVNRRRYNLLTDDELQRLLKLGPEEKMISSGFPLWESLLKAPCFLKRGGDDEIVERAFKAFDELIEANGLHNEGIQLHILDETYRRHIKSSLTGQIMIEKGIFQHHNTPERIAAHIAPLLASEILHQREENSSDMIRSLALAACSVLLVPITFLAKKPRWITIPFMAVSISEFVGSSVRQHFYEDEADLVALELLDKAGVNVTEMFYYWGTEHNLMVAAVEKWERIGFEKMDDGDLNRLEVLLNWSHRRFENTIKHLKEGYPDRLPKQGESNVPPAH